MTEEQWDLAMQELEQHQQNIAQTIKRLEYRRGSVLSQMDSRTANFLKWMLETQSGVNQKIINLLIDLDHRKAESDEGK